MHIVFCFLSTDTGRSMAAHFLKRRQGKLCSPLTLIMVVFIFCILDVFLTTFTFEFTLICVNHVYVHTVLNKMFK